MMNNSFLIQGATIVNEGTLFEGDLRIQDGKIKTISKSALESESDERIIDGKGKILIPGIIDDQVHFRDPGLTHKGDLYTESRAAVAGGITSFMEMPNTVPNTLTQELLEEKYQKAAEVSPANFSFFMGASNDNLEEVLKTDPSRVCGVKVFMGSSTGNMLVDNRETLTDLFRECRMLIATHCEDEPTVRKNMEIYREKYGENVPISAHPLIRSEEACYRSSSKAIELATKHDTRLHILHISTAKEVGLFRNDIPLSDKRITAEACIHHLWFTDANYIEKGTTIKWNPAVKTAADRSMIRQGVLDNRIDIIATDHAPHTIEEKQNTYFSAPSGGPLVQHSLVAMYEMVLEGWISLERMVEKMCHAPADLFQMDKRGYLREGYWADVVLLDPKDAWTVSKDNILYKCGWSPFEGQEFSSKVTHTFVNGHLAYEHGKIDDSQKGQRLSFNRS